MIHSDFLIRAIHLTPKPAERPALFSRFWGLRLRRYLDIPNCILSELWQSREIIVPVSFQRRDKLKRARQKPRISTTPAHFVWSVWKRLRTEARRSQNCWSVSRLLSLPRILGCPSSMTNSFFFYVYGRRTQNCVLL